MVEVSRGRRQKLEGSPPPPVDQEEDWLPTAKHPGRLALVLRSTCWATEQCCSRMEFGTEAAAQRKVCVSVKDS